MSNYTFLIGCLLFSFFFGYSQEKGDPDYLYQDLNAALEHPDWVYHLNLSKNKLEEFPKAIFAFQNLKTLDLSKNKISLLPAEIGQLGSLEKLDLSRNELSLLPPQIGELKRLTELNLEKNTLQYLPEEIGGLKNLEVLKLWANELEKVPREIQQLQQLKVLNLRGMIFDQSEIDKLSEYLPMTNILNPSPCNCKP